MKTLSQLKQEDNMPTKSKKKKVSEDNTIPQRRYRVMFQVQGSNHKVEIRDVPRKAILALIRSVMRG
jgi:hypothetical protein